VLFNDHETTIQEVNSKGFYLLLYSIALRILSLWSCHWSFIDRTITHFI